MDKQAWEDKCNGCGRCCLHKIEFMGGRYYFNVACKWLDLETARCTVYENRQTVYPQCVVLEQDGSNFEVLPTTCPYLPDPEPCEDQSIIGKDVVSAVDVREDELLFYIIDWIKPYENN